MFNNAFQTLSRGFFVSAKAMFRRVIDTVVARNVIDTVVA